MREGARRHVRRGARREAQAAECAPLLFLATDRCSCSCCCSDGSSCPWMPIAHRSPLSSAYNHEPCAVPCTVELRGSALTICLRAFLRRTNRLIGRITPMTIALWRAVYDPRQWLALCARTRVRPCCCLLTADLGFGRHSIAFHSNLIGIRFHRLSIRLVFG